MLLTDRRRGLIFACLAGMEMAWFTPFVVLVLSIPTLWMDAAHPPPIAPLLVFATLWASLLLLMVAIEFLDQRQIDSPRYEIILVALVILTAVVAVRLVCTRRRRSAMGVGWAIWDRRCSIFTVACARNWFWWV